MYGSDEQHAELIEFLHTFRPESHLTSFIQSLHLSGYRSRPTDVTTAFTFRQYPTISSSIFDLVHLTSLRSLALSNLYIDFSRWRFCNILCTIPALEEISLLNLGEKYCAIIESGPPPELCAALRFRLKTLSISVGVAHEIPGMADKLSAIIGLDQSSALISAELHLTYNSADDSERWIRGVCHGSYGTLTHLSVTLNRLIYQGSDVEEQGR